MLTLWYIVLGWKEYNKPFRRAEQPAKPVEPAKKSDLIPARKDGPTLPTDIIKPEPPKSIPTDPTPVATRDSANNRIPDTPKISDVKSNFPVPKSPEVPKTPSTFKLPTPPMVAPKTPETPKTPESPKVAPKTPELPKTPEMPKMPESPKIAPKTPELPKMPEMPKMPESPKVAPKTPNWPKAPETPELPKLPPRTSETSKMPELKLALDPPKKPDVPKGPTKVSDSPKVPDSPNLPEGLKPSRRPESVMPEFPPSGKNPYFPQPNPSEFDLPPYLPGSPQNKPLSRDDELFALGNNFNNPGSNKPIGNLRDLSYAKGEFPEENVTPKGQEVRLPKYMEQSVISNPDSLESDEEDEDL